MDPEIVSSAPAVRVSLVIIGPPGSGKGTQAQRLAERYGIPHISTGAILRAAVREGTALGRQVEETLTRGGLVSDALMTDLVRDRLAQPDARRGFVLDGYPRTAAQAVALDSMLASAPPIVALIAVDDGEIARRLGLRRVCEACGITQSATDVSAEEGEPCPYCGGRLVRRQDDDPETVLNRLQTYATLAAPVIAHYERRPTYAAVDGLRAPDEVTATLRAHIDRVTSRRAS
ncbi:MAG TPA: adenylate kinase [Vicinamibacterales bacterium]|nr:adenylate kinase [Vicinamibacterales bacterium]